jgi:thiol-disulfide isomerase/thioredoxin
MKHALLSALVLTVASPSFADDDLAAENRPAPMFRLPVYNAKEVGAPMVGLDKFVGADSTDKGTKTVLLSFMASFCGPCKKEMPFLQTLHERYAPHGLRVVMVSIDTEPEGQKIIDELIATNKVTFPVLKDRFNLVARRWLGSQSPLPSVFMIRPDGVVASVHRGYSQEASQLLTAEVESKLGVKLPPIAPAPVAAATPAEKPKRSSRKGR